MSKNPKKKMKETKEDFPSQQFLKENIKDEKGAIETYVGEMHRTDDPVQKEAIRGIAIDEMRHKEVLEGIQEKKEEEEPSEAEVGMEIPYKKGDQFQLGNALQAKFQRPTRTGETELTIPKGALVQVVKMALGRTFFKYKGKVVFAENRELLERGWF